MATLKLPKYRCHKIVQAAKIEAIEHLVQPVAAPSDLSQPPAEPTEGSLTEQAEQLEQPASPPADVGSQVDALDEDACVLKLEGGIGFPVNYAWMRRHEPDVGGYLVLYDDGYTSFSPAAAFESGYTKLPAEQQ